MAEYYEDEQRLLTTSNISVKFEEGEEDNVETYGELCEVLELGYAACVYDITEYQDLSVGNPINKDFALNKNKTTKRSQTIQYAHKTAYYDWNNITGMLDSTTLLGAKPLEEIFGKLVGVNITKEDYEYFANLPIIGLTNLVTDRLPESQYYPQRPHLPQTNEVWDKAKAVLLNPKSKLSPYEKSFWSDVEDYLDVNFTKIEKYIDQVDKQLKENLQKAKDEAKAIEEVEAEAQEKLEEIFGESIIATKENIEEAEFVEPPEDVYKQIENLKVDKPIHGVENLFKYTDTDDHYDKGPFDYASESSKPFENPYPHTPSDMVNSPKHYIGKFGLEVEEVLENFIPYYEDGYIAHRMASAIEYLLRSPRKNGQEDIEKARKNIDQIIQYMDKLED